MLTTYSLALTGTSIPLNPDDEMSLVEGFMQATMTAMEQDTVKSPTRNKSQQQRMMEVEAWVQECLSRLKRISRLRERLQQYG
jgi:hypothetical protein